MIKSTADGKIEDTGPLTKKRMETVDDETVSAALDFIERAHKAKKPFYVWWNGTRMHFRTHVKQEMREKANKLYGNLDEYQAGMVEHDIHVGQLLAKLDDLGIADNTIVHYSTDNGPHMNTWPDAASSPFFGEIILTGKVDGVYRLWFAGPARLKRAVSPMRSCIIWTGCQLFWPQLVSLISQHLGQYKEADEAFKEALSLQTQYVPAYVKYANYYQQQGNEKAAYRMLQKGLEQVNNASALHHAVKLSPDNARYQYVYAIAIADTDKKQAIQILEQARQSHSGNLEILSALVSYYKQTGLNEKSELIATKIKRILKVTF